MREVAQEERTALDVPSNGPLDPYRLAAEHGIPVYPINELTDAGCSEAAIRHFTEISPSVWSAALLPVGRRRIIVENPAHTLARRRASIAHELGHHLLEHVFDELLITDDGCRRFDPTQEKEAKFISAELLIPGKAALRAAFAEKTNAQVAGEFGVSEQFAQMCMAGPRIVARRALAKQNQLKS
ncbi:uncharacterized protein DUF955 [Saccharothrix saharensis]|uniref:Uncharacterized protein DUF955 n=1 Tax=Saccharothrix saharensis TaxID=571190 RepID=A0A543JNU7_9PSEU|nr:ImmA/IrrE family metallo-endopeptidase [Saccharothrix saharensis]TQM84506.1 uncharacterized protein DUF955 [Saccharothrix saharensis]